MTIFGQLQFSACMGVGQIGACPNMGIRGNFQNWPSCENCVLWPPRPIPTLKLYFPSDAR